MEYEPYNPYKQNPCLNGNRPEIKPEINIKDIHDRIEDIKQKTPVNNDILGFNISARLLKHVINLQRSTSDEGKIIFDKDKIILSTVDPSHCIMIYQEIPVQNIDEYKINEKIILGFDFDKLDHILKSIKKNDNMLFDYNAELFKANIKLGLFKHEYSFIDIDNLPDHPKQPALTLPASFKINTKLFYDFLVQAGNISDHIEISTTRDKLTLYAYNDSDKVKVEIEKYDLEYFNSPENFKSLFSVDFLITAFKGLKNLFDSVNIKIGNDVPIEITGDNKTIVKVLLAPRIETE